MTDLQSILPGFPSSNITTVLERNFITTTDLLVCDALEIAKRTGLGVLDVRGFVGRVREGLMGSLGMDLASEGGEAGIEGKKRDDVVQKGDGKGKRQLVKNGEELLSEWKMISTLDSGIDTALGGGIPVGYITEITGESGAGKTQLLLSLLLTAQLPPPYGLSRPTLYISTESALPTTRLQQMLTSSPLLSSHQKKTPQSHSKAGGEFHVSLDNIHSIITPDLESQDHILRFQVPVFIERNNIGLIVLDSVAANYRAEFESGTVVGGGGSGAGANMGKRSGELMKLGELFREIAGKHGCAVVVANQVADRFSSVENGGSALRKRKWDGGEEVPGYGARGTQSSPLAAQYLQKQMRLAGEGSGDGDGDTTPGTGPISTPIPIEPPSSILAAAELGLPHPALHNHPPYSPIPNLSAISHSTTSNPTLSTEIMTLDHQQRFFTGWGDSPIPPTSNSTLKTPSLGLIWTTQIACRIVLTKEAIYGLSRSEELAANGVVSEKSFEYTDSREKGGYRESEGDVNERALKGWKRRLRVVFAPWVGGTGPGGEVEVVIRGEGVRCVGDGSGNGD